MRAIIIAAGRAKRMGYLSSDMPKCMLSVNGKTILRAQIDTLKSCGINDIIVVKGYKKEAINYTDVAYRINDSYMDNNILNSLFYAQDAIKGDVLITYGDILFNPEVVNRLIDCKGDIVVVADTAWKDKYHNRNDHPITEAENIVMDSNGRLLEIGKVLNDKDKANAEFIGMARLSCRGADIFKEVFYDAKKKFDGKPFQKARIFKDAYLTDMFQELVDRKHEVVCACIEDGWTEVDTPYDYSIAQKRF